MRRELSLVGASLVAYACALVLGTLVICGTGHASEVVGEWATQGNAAHVRIERCPTAPELLCGLVTWLWEPIDAEGEPVRDKHNPDPQLRARSVIGVSLLEDFRGAPTVRRWRVGSTIRKTDARIAQRSDCAARISWR